MKNEKNLILALVHEEFWKIFSHTPQTESELRERLQQHGCEDIWVAPNTENFWRAFCVITIPPTEENKLRAAVECNISIVIEKPSQPGIDTKHFICLEDWGFLNERSNNNV